MGQREDAVTLALPGAYEGTRIDTERAKQERVRPGAIPASTDLIGRDELVSKVTAKVGERRLVTLTGPGGVGKTAVAQRVAEILRDAPGGSGGFTVTWVSLAEITPGRRDDDDPGHAARIDEAIGRTVASALFANFGGASDDDAISAFFMNANEDHLLVLDNCEHVIAGATRFVTTLLANTHDAPHRLHCLCTTREALGARTEHVEQVTVLAYPPADRARASGTGSPVIDIPSTTGTPATGTTPTGTSTNSPAAGSADVADPGTAHPVVNGSIRQPSASEFPAVDMFLQQAEAMGRPVPADEWPLVAALVREMDGLPLAIEVIARLSRQVSLREILDDYIPRSASLIRQHSGLAALPEGLRVAFTASTLAEDWTDAKGRVFRRLSVFNGPFTLAAAAAICADPDSHDGQANTVRRQDVPVLVRELVDKSMVVVDTTTAPTRFRLLQTMRWFALEQLIQHGSGERQRLRLDHLNYYTQHGAELGTRWTTAEERDILSEFDLDLPNYVAASHTAIDESRHTPELATKALIIAMAVAQTKIGQRRGYQKLVKDMLLDAATANEQLPGTDMLRVGCYTVAGWIALCQGDVDEGERLLDLSLSYFTSDDPASWPSHVVYFYASYLMAVKQEKRSIELLLSVYGKQLEARSTTLARLANLPPHLREAAQAFAGFAPSGLVSSIINSGLAAAALGDVDQADELTQSCLARLAEFGAPSLIAWGQIGRAHALMKADRLDEAREMAEATVKLMDEAGDLWGGIWIRHLLLSIRAELVRSKAGSDVSLADRVECLRLAMASGAARKLRETRNVTRLEGMAGVVVWNQPALDACRELLGTTAWTEAWNEAEQAGYNLDEGQAERFGTRLARAEDPVGVTTASLLATFWRDLSPREAQVVHQAALGLQNGQISRAINTSPSTVETHLQRAREKLGLTRPMIMELRSPIEKLWQGDRPTVRTGA